MGVLCHAPQASAGISRSIHKQIIATVSASSFAIPSRSRTRQKDASRHALYRLRRNQFSADIASAALTITTAAEAPASSGGDITVFLTIAPLLLLLYWVANFVVPDLVTKNLHSGRGEESQETSTRSRK